MSRTTWILGAAIALVVGSVIHDMMAEDNPKKIDASVAAPEHSDVSNSIADTLGVDQKIENSAEPAREVTTELIAQWTIDTIKNDTDKQNAAYEALVKAPRQTVLPVLRKLTTNGDDNDRQAALNALHMLALKQGDADGEIQNILRLTSYDGDDALASDAHVALEDIESKGEHVR